MISVLTHFHNLIKKDPLSFRVLGPRIGYPSITNSKSEEDGQKDFKGVTLTGCPNSLEVKYGVYYHNYKDSGLPLDLRTKVGIPKIISEGYFDTWVKLIEQAQ